jgi:glycerol kinase
MAGDQQAATIGQACFSKGMIKSTYGTGCFMLLNTGKDIVYSKNRLLTTIAYRINNEIAYGLEGSIFCAGVTIKWLRDTMHMIETACESEALAKDVASTEGVYFIPAFTGMGAPHWDPDARAEILGLTRNSNRAHIVRAALESVAYQTADLLTAMQIDFNASLTKLRVDGGMVANNWLMQFLADMLNIEVQRPICIETTALGAAYLAGLQIGLYKSLTEISASWCADTSFEPRMEKQDRESLYAGWNTAINRIVN